MISLLGKAYPYRLLSIDILRPKRGKGSICIQKVYVRVRIMLDTTMKHHTYYTPNHFVCAARNSHNDLDGPSQETAVGLP